MVSFHLLLRCSRQRWFRTITFVSCVSFGYTLHCPILLLNHLIISKLPYKVQREAVESQQYLFSNLVSARLHVTRQQVPRADTFCWGSLSCGLNSLREQCMHCIWFRKFISLDDNNIRSRKKYNVPTKKVENRSIKVKHNFFENLP